MTYAFLTIALIALLCLLVLAGDVGELAKQTARLADEQARARHAETVRDAELRAAFDAKPEADR